MKFISLAILDSDLLAFLALMVFYIHGFLNYSRYSLS